jgi:5-amino-6-(5-phospho-D-ribitylamino)uracil phosphatase
MSIRLIAIDLDGTLINTRGEISPRNQSCLRQAAEQGIDLVIVTGRRFHSALPFLKQVPGPAAVISSNGARIGTISGQTLHTNLLPRETARLVLAASADYWGYAAAFFDVPGRGQIMMHRDAAPDGPLGWYLKSCPDCILQAPDLIEQITSDPLQVTFGGPPKVIEPLEPVLRNSPVASDVHLTWTKYLARNLSLLDVMNRTCSKGAALAYWSRHCGISREEVMAIGDNLNDLEMLEFAGQPVLMANHNWDAVPAGWPMTDSNDEDGVAHAIERYVLLP